MPPFSFEELETRGVAYVSVPMICLYPAAKAMTEALRELRTGRDIAKMASMGVSWAEFNELVGLSRWRRLELASLSEEECTRIYGSSDLDEIISKELAGTDKVWKKKVG